MAGEPVRAPAPAGVIPAPPTAANRAVPDPGEVAVAAGLATRMPDNCVVFAPPPGVSGVARQAASATSPSASPSTSDAQAGAPGPASPGTAPTVAGVDRATPDLTAMADELYERIEYRLRSDLLLERERRGWLPDP